MGKLINKKIFILFLFTFLLVFPKIISAEKGFFEGAQNYFKDYCKNSEIPEFVSVNCYLFESNEQKNAKISELKNRLDLLTSEYAYQSIKIIDLENNLASMEAKLKESTAEAFPKFY